MAARFWPTAGFVFLSVSSAFSQGTAGYGSTFDLAAQLFTGERNDVYTLVQVGPQRVSERIGPLVQKSNPDSAGYAITAFALAVNGVDPEVNLGRLVGPLKRAAQGKVEELEPSNGLAPNQVLMEDIPRALYLVYRARKYVPALEALLTAPMEGAVAENRDDIVMEILQSNPRAVLSLASTNPKVYERTWDIVDWNIGSRSARQSFINRMRSTKWPSPAWRAVAHKLAKDLQKPKNRS